MEINSQIALRNAEIEVAIGSGLVEKIDKVFTEPESNPIIDIIQNILKVLKESETLAGIPVFKILNCKVHPHAAGAVGGNRIVARDYDAHLYKLRHLVENAFLRLKRLRGVVTRYAKSTSAFRGAVVIASILQWLRLSA